MRNITELRDNIKKAIEEMYSMGYDMGELKTCFDMNTIKSRMPYVYLGISSPDINCIEIILRELIGDALKNEFIVLLHVNCFVSFCHSEQEKFVIHTTEAKELIYSRNKRKMLKMFLSDEYKSASIWEKFKIWIKDLFGKNKNDELLQHIIRAISNNDNLSQRIDSIFIRSAQITSTNNIAYTILPQATNKWSKDQLQSRVDSMMVVMKATMGGECQKDYICNYKNIFGDFFTLVEYFNNKESNYNIKEIELYIQNLSQKIQSSKDNNILRVLPLLDTSSENSNNDEYVRNYFDNGYSDVINKLFTKSADFTNLHERLRLQYLISKISIFAKQCEVEIIKSIEKEQNDKFVPFENFSMNYLKEKEISQLRLSIRQEMREFINKKAKEFTYICKDEINNAKKKKELKLIKTSPKLIKIHLEMCNEIQNYYYKIFKKLENLGQTVLEEFLVAFSTNYNYPLLSNTKLEYSDYYTRKANCYFKIDISKVPFGIFTAFDECCKNMEEATRNSSDIMFNYIFKYYDNVLTDSLFYTLQFYDITQKNYMKVYKRKIDIENIKHDKKIALLHKNVNKIQSILTMTRLSITPALP